MSRGGANPDGTRRGGRQKGTPNKATSAKMDAIKAGGKLPLDVMLGFMRDTKLPKEFRAQMAAAAAPYVHARLASVEQKHSGNVNVTHEEAVDLLS